MNTCDIIYQDQDLLVVNKPHDVLTVPGKGPEKQDCLINRLLVNYPNARIVHRLDMATSGLILIALSYEAQRHLSIQFQERAVTKHYIAVIYGQPADANGSVELPLICDWPNRPKQIVDTENGKPALTHYNVIGHEGIGTRVKLTPVTGRSHQLRVHMQAIGHPILGDHFYAHEKALAASERLQLHASDITFAHPVSQETMTFHCPAEF